MATNPSVLGALLYASESAFGETSTTYGTRLPIVNNVNDIISALRQDKMPTPIIQQYNNAGRIDSTGIYEAEFPITLYLTGHGSTCAGAVSATALPTFLGICLGGSNAGETGTTVDTPTSAVQWTKAGGTLVAGSACRLGTVGDNRGNGEFYVVDNATTVTTLNGAEAQPNSGDVVYGVECVHTNESATTCSSVRFNAQTTNQRYGIWGAYCSGMAISGLNVGEIPQVTATMRAARWASESGSTYPTATSVDSFVPAPCTAGALFINTVGTSTRAMRTCRDVQIGLEFQVYPLLGYNSDNTSQTIVGVVRGAVTPTISWTEDAEAAGTETLQDIYDATALKHICFTASAADGSAMGFYFANAKCVTPKPTQFDGNGLNQVRITFQGMSGPTTTTEVTHSAFRMFFA